MDKKALREAISPSTSDYGRLSVMLQWRYAMQNVLFVPPESFDPPPRVDSAVVRMVPRAEPAPRSSTLPRQLGPFLCWSAYMNQQLSAVFLDFLVV